VELRDAGRADRRRPRASRRTSGSPTASRSRTTGSGRPGSARMSATRLPTAATRKRAFWYADITPIYVRYVSSDSRVRTEPLALAHYVRELRRRLLRLADHRQAHVRQGSQEARARRIEDGEARRAQQGRDERRDGHPVPRLVVARSGWRPDAMARRRQPRQPDRVTPWRSRTFS
jgi:hypothetical protein